MSYSSEEERKSDSAYQSGYQSGASSVSVVSDFSRKSAKVYRKKRRLSRKRANSQEKKAKAPPHAKGFNEMVGDATTQDIERMFGKANKFVRDLQRAHGAGGDNFVVEHSASRYRFGDDGDDPIFLAMLWMILVRDTSRGYPHRVRFYLHVNNAYRIGGRVMRTLVTDATHSSGPDGWYRALQTFIETSTYVAGQQRSSFSLKGIRIESMQGTSPNFDGVAGDRAKQVSNFVKQPARFGQPHGWHSYGSCFIQKFALAKLYLHDQSCIIESLAIILAVQEGFQPKNDTYKERSERVVDITLKFFSQPAQRAAIVEGDVYKILEIYNANVEGFKQVFVFDAHFPKEEFFRLLGELGQDRTDRELKRCGHDIYLLAIEHDHVVPIHSGQISHYSREREEKYSVRRGAPITIRALPEIWKTRIDRAHTEQDKKGMNIRARKSGFNLDEKNHKDRLQIQEIVDLRSRKFDKSWAVCGIDIETYIDNVNVNDFTGNFKPYLISISGCLQRLEMRMDSSNRLNIEVITDEVCKSFWGEDAAAQFVEYIIAGGYYQCYMRGDNKGGSYKANKKVGVIRNCFFAHNGFGFDYRFLYQVLFAYIGHVNFIGDLTQTKHAYTRGLYFYDTCLLMPQKLSELAVKFFPDKPNTHRKLDSDKVVGIEYQDFLNLTDTQKEEIITYCEQDAFLVKEIAYTFFRRVYLEYNGHAFMKQPFYYSAAQLAWEIQMNSFLKENIFIDPQVLDYERASYRGGLSICYRTFLHAGISIDINSAYPAAMQNEMPFSYLVEEVQGRCEEYDGEADLVPYYLYFAQFKFSNTAVFPTIAVRCTDTIICPLTNEDCEDGGTWLWGVELRTAREVDENIVIRVKSVIRYKPLASHRQFIQTFYEKRQNAKQASPPDHVADILYKLIMNSQYGKHGQKDFKKFLIGDYRTIAMHTQFLNNQVNASKVKMEEVSTDWFDLFALKYQKNNSQVEGKGSTVRFASYITALARCNLMYTVNYCASIFGVNSIVYTDTDSIYLDVLQQESHWQNSGEVLDMDAQKQQILEKMQEKNFDKHLRVNVCNIADKTDVVPILSETELGAFKIEHFIFQSYFLGCKQYIAKFIGANGVLQSVGKLKGVPAHSRDEFRMSEMYRQLRQNQQGEDGLVRVYPEVFNIKGVFRRFATSVHLLNMSKVIRPTLNKRIHIINAIDDTSQPFESSTTFLQRREETNQINKEAAQQLMKQISSHKKIDREFQILSAKLKLQCATRQFSDAEFEDRLNKRRSFCFGRMQMLRQSDLLTMVIPVFSQASSSRDCVLHAQKILKFFADRVQLCKKAWKKKNKIESDMSIDATNIDALFLYSAAAIIFFDYLLQRAVTPSQIQVLRNSRYHRILHDLRLRYLSLINFKNLQTHSIYDQNPALSLYDPKKDSKACQYNRYVISSRQELIHQTILFATTPIVKGVDYSDVDQGDHLTFRLSLLDCFKQLIKPTLFGQEMLRLSGEKMILEVMDSNLNQVFVNIFSNCSRICPDGLHKTRNENINVSFHFLWKIVQVYEWVVELRNNIALLHRSSSTAKKIVTAVIKFVEVFQPNEDNRLLQKLFRFNRKRDGTPNNQRLEHDVAHMFDSFCELITTCTEADHKIQLQLLKTSLIQQNRQQVIYQFPEDQEIGNDVDEEMKESEAFNLEEAVGLIQHRTNFIEADANDTELNNMKFFFGSSNENKELALLYFVNQEAEEEEKEDFSMMDSVFIPKEKRKRPLDEEDLFEALVAEEEGEEGEENDDVLSHYSSIFN